MTEVEFHPEARLEFFAAAAFYESQSPGLGRDFITLVERTCSRLLRFPESGRPFGGRLRRALVPRFPYGLIYKAADSRIFIVAVMHLHRRPGYWRGRT